MDNATNMPIDGSTNLTPKDNGLNLGDLTDRNWLFIKHYLETNDLEKSYVLAGYEGEKHSAKFDLMRKLKPYIEELLSLGKVSRLSLMADLNKALSIPLIDKDRLTVSEWLRLRKFAGSLIPELKEDRKVSVLVINRCPDKGNMGKDNNPPLNIPPSNIIEGQIVADTDEDKE